jgi:hypothetical protein
MMDDDYRTAELSAVDWQFTPMPSPAEQKRQHAAEQKRLQAEAEKAAANRSRLSSAKADTAPERRGLSRDQIFSSLKRYLPND